MKANLQPYTSVDDPWFDWLESNFLKWVIDWENEITGLNDLTKSARNKFILSQQTVDGLKITTQAFIELGKIVLSEPGAKFLLPEKLNQDRLETFFGKMRRGCGDTENPTVDQARQRILALLVAGRSIMPPKNRNCDLVDDEVGVELFMPRARYPKQKLNNN